MDVRGGHLGLHTHQSLLKSGEPVSTIITPTTERGGEFGGGEEEGLVIMFNDIGYLSPLLPENLHGDGGVSYWGVLWNEFLGTLVFGLMGRLFVAFFGGTAFAATIPTLFGTAFANAFTMFGSLMVFGAISGGHFNGAITLAVFLVELFARFGWFGTFNWEAERDGHQKHPWRTLFGLLLYFPVQFVAYLGSALLIWGFMPGKPRHSPIALGIPVVTGTVSNGKTFGVELVGAFLFIVAYLMLLKMFGNRGPPHTKTWDQQVKRAGAFSLWYFALIVVFAPWAGAVWNPTLWFSFALISGHFYNWYVLLWPPLISGAAAALFILIHWWIGQTRGLRDLRKLQTTVRGTSAAVHRFGRNIASSRIPPAAAWKNP